MSKSLGIVVGVDGSEPGRQALEWALEEARLRQLRVTAVHAWDFNYYPAGVLMEAGSLEAKSRELLKAAVDPFWQNYSDVSIETKLVRKSSAAAALKDASQDAELVVVGSRGYGGIVGLFLGSVSNAIVQRADCPVVVIH